MSTQPTTHAEPRLPKCPHCKKDLAIVVLHPYEIGQLLIPSISCPYCQVLLHINIIMPQPQPVDPADPNKPPKIWGPS